MLNSDQEGFSRMPTSNVNLTADLAEFVQNQVESGEFNNNSEVHRAALVAMKKAEEERKARLAWLRGGDSERAR